MNQLLDKRFWRKLPLHSTFFTLLVLLLLAPATTSAELQAAAIAQTFETDESLVVEGSLMSLQQGRPGQVELASTDNVNSLVGVAGNDPLIQLGSGNGNSVQVITSGVTVALVSDMSGDIKTGDKITASPILGVGAKVAGSAMIIGTAQADLSSVTTTQHSITDIDGASHTVRVGLIPVQVDVSFHSEAGGQTFIPAFLQEFADSAAGKQVSPVRVLIAILVLILAFVSVAVLLYAAVRSSIISIGRNPLSEGLVRKGLFQTSLGALGIIAGAVVLIVLVIRT